MSIKGQLTKSAYFTLIKVDYKTHQLAKIYVKEILKLYGVPFLSSQTMSFSLYQCSREITLEVG